MSLRATPTCDRCGASVAAFAVSTCNPCRAELRREILRSRAALAAQMSKSEEEPQKILARAVCSLHYRNPRADLIALREVATLMADSDLDPRVRALRTNDLNKYRWGRQAALFSFLVGARADRPVHYAPFEAQDFDCVLRWETNGEPSYCIVQLKEVVPSALNPQASVQAEIGKLSKYATSRDLVVAVHLNQELHFDPKALHIPNLSVRELWVFGCVAPEQNEWVLWGDFLSEATESQHAYPTTR